MVKHLKKVGAIILAGTVVASAATAVLATKDMHADNPINIVKQSAMSSYEDHVSDTVIADVDNSQPMAVPQDTKVKYSMLGC